MVARVDEHVPGQRSLTHGQVVDRYGRARWIDRKADVAEKRQQRVVELAHFCDLRSRKAWRRARESLFDVPRGASVLLHALFTCCDVDEEPRVAHRIVSTREADPRAAIVLVRRILLSGFDVLPGV